ncbi:MAG: hypothetical protein JKX73_07355, partial [Flavobacteriales bacterium]|nr:hypothetical protein [Flavobacteriales bacterium]
MRTLAIILTLFISIDAMSQCMSDGSKMLSGTIIVKKINVTPEEGIPYLFTTYSGIESIYTKVTVAVPDELAYTLAQYSAMANNYDKRYESVSAFNVRITKDDSSETLFSLNRVLTTEMMDALS